MAIHPLPLAAQVDLAAAIEQLCTHIAQVEPRVLALIPEEGRCARLAREAHALQARFPAPAARPALYGGLLGVKDIFHAAGFPTFAGSSLPAHELAGTEATVVTRLRAAGMLVLGKTVTTEFANFEPGVTRNPHNPAHTPGGSSSGSAAAVAAGMCHLALGSQTIGSVIRPAAFCGVVGFVPSYGRIPTDGLILCAASFDVVGLFARDVASVALAAAVGCDGWRPVQPAGRPVIGVPEGPYLAQASPAALESFASQLATLRRAGYTVRHVPALEEIAAINQRHRRLVAYEMAVVHRAWFARYQPLYRPRTAAVLREGAQVAAAEAEAARAGRASLRASLHARMEAHGIDLWAAPSATGPAPASLDSTGDPAMSVPWTHAGMPAVSLPAGTDPHGLPLGLQLIARAGDDEALLARARTIAPLLAA